MLILNLTNIIILIILKFQVIILSCRIYFIRHGESLGNKNEVFLGHTDIDLSPLGYAQAKETASYLNNIHIDKVYSSDLSRAYNTCNEYLKLSGKNAQKKKELREIFAGEWENKKYSVLKTEYKESYETWLTDIGNAHPENGESLGEVQRRVVDCVSDIARSNDGKTVAIFTHACALRTFITYANHLPLSEMKNIKWATNASVTVVDYIDGDFNVIEYSNDLFLGELKSSRPKNV